MKQLFYILFFSLHFYVVVLAQANQAITNRLCPGRFGDKIVYYAVAKWISHKFTLPFFLKPFEYSSLLRLGKEEKKYSDNMLQKFKDGLQKIKSEQDVIIHAANNVLFEFDKHFYVNGSHRKEDWLRHIIKDQQFMRKLKYMLYPALSLMQIKLPLNKITVAVHIRKGGGVDKPLYSMQYYANRIEPYADKQWPRKFPPEQYYVDQIKKISHLFDERPLFVYLFTDDENQRQLVNRMKKAVNKSNITFACREKISFHKTYVVEDFYNMAQFDCLIRPDSCFSMAAQLLGNHKVIILPKHAKWEGEKLIIDEVAVIDNRIN
ncbi:MAG: hypothetical protein WCD44_00865 [Candidatus Babeliales bacterium]|jgi:hypothetical protein